MALTRRSLMLGMAGAALGLARGANAATQSEGGRGFGSYWRVTTDHRFDLARMRPKLEETLARINRQMSPYQPQSDLSHFNARQVPTWQQAPADLCNVTAKALRVAQLTEGSFDPTVGPLVARYGFGPIKGVSGTYRDIQVNGHALRKFKPELTLDLCGIAKGYALDEIIDLLMKTGVENALVEVGGEVKTIGAHPDRRPWAVALADPRPGAFRVHRIVAPGAFALATSGHAVQGHAGRPNTSHIIHPHSGRPASTTLASVSVLARDGWEADAFATALCAAGPDAGVQMAHRLGIAACFLLTNNAELSELITPPFAHHILV